MLSPLASGGANFAFAARLIGDLAAGGAGGAVLCPGSRSAPLAAVAATTPGLRVFPQLDERSAGYFALGLCRARRAPVLLICTSGTAAANFAPAVAEASLSRAPLLLLCADRPPEMRGWGAAQTIDQVQLFGSHVRWFAEAPAPSESQPQLALARALAPKPVLLLLDEPFSNLDPDMTYRMREELLHLLKTTCTTAILVTHDHEEALGMADAVAVLYRGQLEQFASPEIMYHLPASPFVARFVGQADFIPGTIHEAAVETPVGNFPVPQDYRGGPEVVVMIRPDDIQIGENGSCTGTIQSRQFRGSETRYGIRLPSGDLIHSSASSTQRFPLHTRVTLHLKATHTVLFDRNTD